MSRQHTISDLIDRHIVDEVCHHLHKPPDHRGVVRKIDPVRTAGSHRYTNAFAAARAVAKPVIIDEGVNGGQQELVDEPV